MTITSGPYSLYLSGGHCYVGINVVRILRDLWVDGAGARRHWGGKDGDA